MSDNQAPTAGPGPLPAAVAAAPPPDQVLSPRAGGGGLLAVIERLATHPNINVEVIDRILAQRDKEEERRREDEKRDAERAFNSAMSLAKGELGPVLKTHDVDFTSMKGTRTRYKYESFADVARAVDPVFARHGLSYRFSVEQQGKQVKVICIISHADGHSERMPLEGEIDQGSTGMSLVQALGSVLTYLQRYSLRAAIGLAAAVDDDGRAAAGTSPRISKEQADELAELINETGRSETTLLRLIGVESILDMTVAQWTRAKEVLDLAKAEQKQRRKQNAPAGE